MAKIERIREVFYYYPEVGVLTWAVAPSTRVKVGQVAGTARPDGGRQVRLDGKLLLVHRVAWALIHGEWPEGEIDHINGDRADNRLENLRCVDRRTNCENKRKAQKNNRLGALGVGPHNSGYCARLRTFGKDYYLGHFDSVEAAALAYVEAKRRLHAGCTL
jgi:hypothetical protein